jgi:hypothetical protein
MAGAGLLKRLVRDRRGMAAVEFALIAPTLIVLFMGVLEMTFRFRANEETTRYVHQAADLIAREANQTNADLREVYNAAVYMMKPLETVANLDMDVTSIGFHADTAAPYARWRRVIGGQTPLTLADAEGLGSAGESIIHVGVRFRYSSPVSSLFGGPNLTIVREAWARPRTQRIITINGNASDSNGAAVTITAS